MIENSENNNVPTEVEALEKEKQELLALIASLEDDIEGLKKELDNSSNSGPNDLTELCKLGLKMAKKIKVPKNYGTPTENLKKFFIDFFERADLKIKQSVVKTNRIRDARKKQKESEE